ncbi:MAG: translation elongation factor Ts [Gammaproteobacteria bacterium]|jgi:elongation factor Ts|nr:translation elongation factor Ts [Gammaproteobacteria bacterium]
MQITAALVKELRERTGAGMMECKKALTETAGDMDAAVELMRKSGQAKADKKSGRIAAEGVVTLAMGEGAQTAAIVEVNCETDFVAKDDSFGAFAAAVAETVLEQSPASVEALNAMNLAGSDDHTVEQSRLDLVSKIGENIQVRRFERVVSDGGQIGSYLHGTRIGVLVDAEGGEDTLVRDVAMHIAASRPMCVAEADVPPGVLEKEKEILSAQAASSGKPANIIEKMVEGRIRKYLGEITLLGQPFVKDPERTVGALLGSADAKVNGFVRFEVGEGLEKKQENFAEEVMAQVKGA